MNFVDMTVHIPVEGYESVLTAIRESGLKIIDLSFDLSKANSREVEFDTSYLKVTVCSSEDFDKASNLLKSVLQQYC